MITGGRILHHLAKRLPDSRSSVVLVGYQGEGTRGRQLQDGAKMIRIFGEMVPVRAEGRVSSVLAVSLDRAAFGTRWKK